ENSTIEIVGLQKKDEDLNLIERDQNIHVLQEKEIRQLGTRSLGQIAQLQSGVTLTPGGSVSFRGSRTDASTVFIDGVRVIGSNTQTQMAQSNFYLRNNYHYYINDYYYYPAYTP